MQIQPYLFYNGRCEEAIKFYAAALGAEVTLQMRYADSPQPIPPGMLPAGFEQKIMHASLRIGDAVVMMSDGNTDAPATFKGVTLSLNVDNPAQAETFFAALSQGGQVQMPLAPTFYSPSFGMLADRFGVGWMVNTMAA